MKKRFACVCFAVLLCLCQCGCSVKGENHFSYRGKDFCAEVRGEMRGIGFSAVIACSVEASGFDVGVRYLAPATLSRLEVTAFCDADGVPKSVGQLSWEGVESEVDADEITGLLLPICAFLRRSEISEVGYDGDCRRLTLSDGSILTLGGDGAPRSLQSEEIEVEIVWLEWSSELDLLKK